MIGVHLEAGAVTVRRMPAPRRPKGSALIRLICGGICNTDIELLRGYYGFKGTPGHEFVGEVVDSDDPGWVGRRVVGEINLPCGHCDWCTRGLGRHCPRRTVLGIVRHPGAFRELLTLPEANLRAVPAKVKTEHAVFTEPIAAACEILDQVRIPRGEKVAVLGDGKLGLLIGQTLRFSGMEVHQYGRHKEKLRIAEAAGIDARLSNKLPAAAYDYVVEATGSSEGLMQAVGMTRPRGTIIMKSTVHGTVALDAAPVIVNEITLVGSRCGRFEPALKLLQTGKLQLDQMISEECPLADAPRAFARAQERGVLKVLLRGS
ncbi:MDR/zinc-dependent alcohol dehydrogenase-like family protein [Paludibaculum fermentans]|uniref:MDR/zinc-dependent alcohol dehydrogenase-like family protein n=1 Tax=Paludibaculum fermentans TaxID=1473598 RepID=UPI003EB92B33